jgi:hypothetical protein
LSLYTWRTVSVVAGCWITIGGRKRRPGEALVVGLGPELGFVLAGGRSAPVVLDEHAVEPALACAHIEQLDSRREEFDATF